MTIGNILGTLGDSTPAWLCRKCGGQTHVTDTRKVNGELRRNRRCKSCDARSATLEIRVADRSLAYSTGLSILSKIKKVMEIGESHPEEEVDSDSTKIEGGQAISIERIKNGPPFDVAKEYETMIEKQVRFTGSASSTLSEREKSLLNRLKAIHGPVRISRESSGLHFYIGSPEEIKRRGARELQWNALHLSIPVDKYLKGDVAYGYDHKNGTTYPVEGLLMMPKIETRLEGFEGEIARTEMGFSANHGWASEMDEEGRMRPIDAGVCIPLTELDLDHPATAYLNTRKGGPILARDLVDQFDAGYCTEAHPKIRRKPFDGGITKDGYGKIIFRIWQLGFRAGWQARVIDFIKNDIRYVWDPLQKHYRPLFRRNFDNPEKVTWDVLPPFDRMDRFELPKYILASECRKASCLMGLDGVRNRFTGTRLGEVIFLTEGPMDAARMWQAGYPAVAIMGKHLSHNQASLVCNLYDRVVVMADNDKAGSTMAESATKSLTPLGMKPIIVQSPTEGEDPGDMSLSRVQDLVTKEAKIKPLGD